MHTQAVRRIHASFFGPIVAAAVTLGCGGGGDGDSTSAPSMTTTDAASSGDDVGHSDTGETTGAVTTTEGTTGSTGATTGSTDPTTATSGCGVCTTGETEDPVSLCGDGFVGFDEGCDLGAMNDDHGACTTDCRPGFCGDGLLFAGMEVCDDGNTIPDDGCANDCGVAFSYTTPRIVSGGLHTCVLSDAGKVRCWGGSHEMIPQHGQLGAGIAGGIGDDPGEMPPDDVPLGATATQVVAGNEHTCALLAGGAVKCWGRGAWLGLGITDDRGDQPGELPTPDVDLGGPAVQLSAGNEHTCALMASGKVRCWGFNMFQQLGVDGAGDVVGDEPGEMPPADVAVSGKVVQLDAGSTHTCALLDSGVPICWGQITPPEGGPPAPVYFGGFVVQLSHGDRRLCALLAGGQVRCRGLNNWGEAGYGHTNEVFDPIVAGDVPVGAPVKRLVCGAGHTCAIVESGALRCWGNNAAGNLGYGHSESLGDDPGELPTADVELGGPPIDVAAGLHTCVIIAGGSIRCWGDNSFGSLGLGDHENIGDQPGEMPPPDVPVF